MGIGIWGISCFISNLTAIANEDNDILEKYGGFAKNSLLHAFDFVNDNDDEEPVLFDNSMYMSDDALMNSLTERKDIFKVLSLNCQSLYAKFDQLYVLIEKLRRNGNEFDAICLQETWIDDDMDTTLLHLPSYNLISKTKTTSLHGGLAIYIKNCYRYTTVLG